MPATFAYLSVVTAARCGRWSGNSARCVHGRDWTDNGCCEFDGVSNCDEVCPTAKTGFSKCNSFGWSIYVVTQTLLYTACTSEHRIYGTEGIIKHLVSESRRQNLVQSFRMWKIFSNMDRISEVSCSFESSLSCNQYHSNTYSIW